MVFDEAKKLDRHAPVGESFGHFTTIRLLGAGGMGEVYLARDTKLSRDVALKILPPDIAGNDRHKKRLIHEAQAASRLNHPNICTVYETGETEDGRFYIAMEYVAGKTLEDLINGGALSSEQALNLASQIADGLAEAHDAGIIHRDIKPSNILVDVRGRAKILDFGLAKLLQNPTMSDSDAETKSLLSQFGAIVGTVPYMSPEQLKGETLDPTTDIFSFGVTLYEMLSQRNPFYRTTNAETMAAILNDDPPALGQVVQNVPANVERVVSNCLEKDRKIRTQSMHDVTTEISSSISLLGASGSFPLRKRTVEVKKARPFVVSRKTIWSIGAAVFIMMSLGAGVFLKYRNVTTPQSAQDIYLQGKFYNLRENRADNEKAMKLLEQAVAADPNDPRKHAELSMAYARRSFYFAPDQNEWAERSTVEYQKAFAISPDLSEAHLARALLLWSPANRFPHEQAISSYRKAILSDPNIPEAHHQLGNVLMHIGLLEEANAELRKALDLDPSNTLARYRLSSVLNVSGKFDEAYEGMKAIPPDFNPALVSRNMGYTLIVLGRREEAAQLIDEMLAKFPGDEGGQFTSLKAVLSALSGDETATKAQITQAIEKGKGYMHFHHTAYQIAAAYAILNMPAESVRFLRDTADNGFPCYPLFEKDPNLDRIRQSPEFKQFMTEQKSQWENRIRSLRG